MSEVITRVYAYQDGGKFYRITVKLSPQAIARDAMRKGLGHSKTRKASRANGSVNVEAVEVDELQARRIAAQKPAV